jgi:hypothetical protein
MSADPEALSTRATIADFERALAAARAAAAVPAGV